MSTLSKTPPHNPIKDGGSASGGSSNIMMQHLAASLLFSPMLFDRKKDSRFQFAQSLDPVPSALNALDWDEIEVPAKIQDLIERNIRTLSNGSL
jgi:hypothetical protein